MARKDRINQNPFNIDIDVNTPIKKVNEKNPFTHSQSSSFVEKKVFREVIDTEGRVFELLECGHE